MKDTIMYLADSNLKFKDEKRKNEIIEVKNKNLETEIKELEERLSKLKKMKALEKENVVYHGASFDNRITFNEEGKNFSYKKVFEKHMLISEDMELYEITNCVDVKQSEKNKNKNINIDGYKINLILEVKKIEQ